MGYAIRRNFQVDHHIVRSTPLANSVPQNAPTDTAIPDYTSQNSQPLDLWLYSPVPNHPNTESLTLHMLWSDTQFVLTCEFTKPLFSWFSCFGFSSVCYLLIAWPLFSVFDLVIWIFAHHLHQLWPKDDFFYIAFFN